MDELLVEKGLISHQLSFCLSGPPIFCKREEGLWNWTMREGLG
jgi:hypothetical protein